MAMQKLNVRFSDEIKIALSETAKGLGVTDSEVARDAMKIGLTMMSGWVVGHKKINKAETLK
jgi:predicted transcriptional regulator